MCKDCNGCGLCSEKKPTDWEELDRIWEHKADNYEEEASA